MGCANASPYEQEIAYSSKTNGKTRNLLMSCVREFRVCV